ncbi:MAG: hypothetical protein EBQ89_00725 [Alphaproteobacteria bacterium]|nr:hypothetical protein [Alphaproteobacteria bacterium]
MKFLIEQEQFEKVKQTNYERLSDLVYKFIKNQFPKLYLYEVENISSTDDEYWDSEDKNDLLFYIRHDKKYKNFVNVKELFILTEFWEMLETWFGELDREFWRVFVKRNYGFNIGGVYQHDYRI